MEKVSATFRVNKKDYEQFKEVCKELRITPSERIRQLMWKDYLEAILSKEIPEQYKQSRKEKKLLEMAKNN